MTGERGRVASGRPSVKRLGYEFTPTPRAAIRAVEQGVIDHLDYVIISALYDRWFPGTASVRFTLNQLRVWSSWTLTDDALSKRLRRLRERGWVAYQQPQKWPYRYEAKLISAPSERGPSRSAADKAASGGERRRIDPSRGRSHPSDGTDGIVVSEPAGKTLSQTVGPSVSDVQSNPSSLEEALVQTSPWTTRARAQGEGPTGDPIADEMLARWRKRAPWARELPPRQRQVALDLYELLGGRERNSVQTSPGPFSDERNSNNG
jgi:hypothetical protein